MIRRLSFSHLLMRWMGTLFFQEEMAKPDPAFYKLFCERYSLKPEEIVFFDDREENINAAKKLGMRAVCVTSDMMSQEARWFSMTSGGQEDMLKVVKFGGSSLASSGQFEKVKNIVEAEESRKYVIPSAPGRRFSGDTKVTDMLYQCYECAQEGKDLSKYLRSESKTDMHQIISGLGLDLNS